MAFSGFVRLRGLGEEESVEAEILNLSAAGMCVASERVPQPGAAVFCRVVIGNDRRIIKGKVAWASPGDSAHPMGAGIEFIDLSKKDSEVLRQVVQTNVAPSPQVVPVVNSDDLGRVEVTFEGLPSPVNARARITPEGIVLTTKLPFLRVGSQVKIRHLGAVEGGRPGAREGKLQAVSLGSTGGDGVPRLLVELAVATDDVSPGRLSTWPLPATTPLSPVPEPLITQDTDPQPFTLPLHASAFAESSDMLEASHEPKDAGPTMEAQDVSDADITPVSDASALMSQLHVEIDSAAAPVSTGGVREMHFPKTLPLPAVWAPLLTPAPVSEPTMRVEMSSGETAPMGARLSTSWKLAIAAAAVVAGAGFFALSGDDLPAVSPKPEPASAAKPAEPSLNTGIRIAPLPREAPAPMATAKITPAAVHKETPAAWRPIADPTWPFTLVAEGDTTTIFIPLQGDQSESRVYAITKPSGLVALLPHGRIRGSVGKYPVRQAGVTHVWVEERETGLHARVVFGSRVLSHQAKLEPAGLRVVAKLRAE